MRINMEPLQFKASTASKRLHTLLGNHSLAFRLDMLRRRLSSYVTAARWRFIEIRNRRLTMLPKLWLRNDQVSSS